MDGSDVASRNAAFAIARGLMVDGQVRPNKVTDPRVIGAMRRIRRERFVPPQAFPIAYTDQEVPLGGGRTLLQPMVIARLVQLAAAVEGERALVVGAGPGYGAALLAACGAQVVALEEDEALLATARTVLPEEAPRVEIVAGTLAEGWPAGAPYDLILIEGAVRAIPPLLAPQLRPGTGRLIAVSAPAGAVPRAVIAEASPIGLHAQPVFDCAAALIPQLLPPKSFEF
jgi:protein-L-isoaspartate(D-aspartate) O-methyltransferase